MSDETREFVHTPQGVMVKVCAPAPAEGLDPQVRWEGPISLSNINDNLGKIVTAIQQKEAEIAGLRKTYGELQKIRDATEALEFPAVEPE